LTFETTAFRDLPSSGRLFCELLYQHANVAEFYPHPATPSAVADFARQLDFPAARRAAVADALERQNRALGSSPAVFANLDRLRSGAVAVLTGQQVGLFGGPLYSLLKAVSAVQMASELTAQGIDAVPVFWMATEDHDLAEVNHAFLPSGGKLERLELALSTPNAAPVGSLPLGPEIEPLVARAAELLGEGAFADLLRRCYAPHETLGTSFGKLFASIFAEHGLILLDPLDAELHRIATPLFLEAAERSDEIAAALIARGERLRAAGFHEQVKVTPESTTLFHIGEHGRRAIHRSGECFIVDGKSISKQQLADDISSTPERFSANVLLRPVLQDWLLPSVVYFGGPGEIAYFAQGSVVHEKLLGRVTPVLPRLSATVLGARHRRLLEKYKLETKDLRAGEESVRRMLGERNLPAGFTERLADQRTRFDGVLCELRQTIAELDPTLGEAAENAGRKMSFQLEKLVERASAAMLRKDEKLAADASELIVNLYPMREMQERTLSLSLFVARHGESLLRQLLEAAATHELGQHRIAAE